MPEEQANIGGESKEPSRGDQADQTKPRAIDLPPGKDLTPEMGNRLAAARLVRLVFLAGEAESGKTTLLAAIYEKFNSGPFAGLIFGGSLTFIGWEQRCHLSRVASGAERPDTERTLGLQHRLLHLRVRDQELVDGTQDLLFTDLSGEVFKLIRDSTAECQQLGMLKRADHFVLLFDGKKLSERSTRHEAQNNGIALLRSCVDAGMVGSRSFVDVVFSKYDLILAAGHDTIEFLGTVRETIKGRLGLKLGRLRFHNIAARPESGPTEYAFGIPELLSSWTRESPYYKSDFSVSLPVPAGSSCFEHYLRVRFPKLSEIQAWK